MNRLTTQRILAVGALATLFAAGVANAAIRPPQDGDRDRPQQARKEHRQEARAERKQQAQQTLQARQTPQAQFRQHGDDRRDAEQAQAQRTGRVDARQAQRADRRDWQQDRRDDQRDARQDRREDRQDWRQDRRDDHRDARNDARQRVAYARYQQDYNRRLRDVRIRIAPRYYVRPAHYRYSYGGLWYTTSNYGADVLRQAVDWGYREGVRAGRVDRNDGWAPDYRDSVAWRDGGFGYGGRYVSSADYAYYFRQGFQRGYDDGYFGRMQYGRYANNDVVIAEAVIATILGLQLLR